jgi:TPR repeat protein
MAAITLFALIAVAILLGGRRHEMGLPLQIGSIVGVAAILAFCIFRIVAFGKRTMPTFADDDPRAAAYYQKVCNEGDMEGCSMLGTCYWTGSCGVAKNGSQGFDLFQKACDGGEMGACGQLGVCYEFGGCGLVKSGERAVAFYEKACSGGEMSMCNNLGVCYHKGECGVGKDDARAAVLYKKACRGGDSGACHNLDLMKN